MCHICTNNALWQINISWGTKMQFNFFWDCALTLFVFLKTIRQDFASSILKWLNDPQQRFYTPSGAYHDPLHFMLKLKLTMPWQDWSNKIICILWHLFSLWRHERIFSNGERLHWQTLKTTVVEMLAERNWNVLHLTRWYTSFIRYFVVYYVTWSIIGNWPFAWWSSY